jgi:hypothetical protein
LVSQGGGEQAGGLLELALQFESVRIACDILPGQAVCSKEQGHTCGGKNDLSHSCVENACRVWKKQPRSAGPTPATFNC